MSDEFHIPWSTPNDSFDKIWSEDSHWDNGSVPDLLSTMYAQQYKHTTGSPDYGHTIGAIAPHKIGDIQSRDVHEKAREFVGYTVEELYEAVGMLKGKPWKAEYKEVDRDAFVEEVADAWHFFLEFLIMVGITPEELFSAYFSKTLVNINRWKNGY